MPGSAKKTPKELAYKCLAVLKGSKEPRDKYQAVVKTSTVPAVLKTSDKLADECLAVLKLKKNQHSIAWQCYKRPKKKTTSAQQCYKPKRIFNSDIGGV